MVSSQSGYDVDCRHKAEGTPSPSGSDDDSEQKAGRTSSQSGWGGMKANLVKRRARAALMTKSDDSLTDEGSAKLRKEAATEKMSVSLPRLDEVLAQIKEMK
jgi:hypothetical protein